MTKPGGDADAIALRKSKRDVKPSARMKESLEYLSRPTASLASVADDSAHIPRTFHEAMRRSDLWLAPMEKELWMMVDKEVFVLVPRPVGKNVVQSRWVYANKFDGESHIID
jgi:hypothetical protein